MPCRGTGWVLKPVNAAVVDLEDVPAGVEQAEAAYDNEVLAGLRKGLAIREALDLAANICPGEALGVDETTIGEIHDHYQYLKSHEEILAKLRVASPKRSKRR